MLVLASASPRRQELLRAAGISFTVQPANVDESLRADEAPRNFAERLAREKALTVSRMRPRDIVLGADTIVVISGSILGKPADGEDAARMLCLLSGRQHDVITAIAVASHQSGGGRDPRVNVASEATKVTMNEISEQEIGDYVSTGEPMDKAGAYAIQGIASRWIPRIEGDYSNVVGLPVALVYRMLRELHVDL